MFIYILLYSTSFRWSPESLSSPPRCSLVPLGSFKSIRIWLDANEGGVRKATGSYRIYSVPGKTAVLVSEFAMENLPSAELQPRFRHLEWRTCPWAKHSNVYILLYYNIKPSILRYYKSVALQLRRAKTDWSGCCQMAVRYYNNKITSLLLTE